MQQQKLGVEDIKHLVTAGAKLGTAFGKVMADGKVTVGDSVYIPQVLGGLKDVADVDFKALFPEAKDLDDAERADLTAAFNEAFDLPADGVEAVVEQGLELTLAIAQALLAFVKVSAKVKAA